MITKLISIILVALHAAVGAAETIVPLDTVVVQLRSRSDSYSPLLLEEVLELTTKYFRDYFKAYYNSVGLQNFFADVNILANSFGIQGTEDSFINTLEFDGELIFNNGHSPPTSDFLLNMMNNAFKGQNLELYLEQFQTSEDPFLEDLTRVIVEINDNFVSDTNIDDSDVSLEDNSQEIWGFTNWVEVAIYAAVGVGGALLIVSLFCLCHCCCMGKGQVQDEGDVANMKIRNIEFEESPSIAQPPQRREVSRSNEVTHDRRMQPSQSRPTPPSPSRSIISQDSSIFTYNPSTMSATKDAGTLSLGSISNININNASTFDLEAWQNPTVISSRVPAPFGHDISAIEQRDQMSIMESDDHNALRTRGSQRLYHKSKMLNKSKSHRNHTASAARSSTSYPYPTKAATRHTATIPEGHSRESSSDMSMSSSSDVISDLKNLSMQINQHRQSKRSPTYRD